MGSLIQIDLKQALIDMLEDDEIKCKIKNIVLKGCENSSEDLNAKIAELESINSSLKDKNKNLLEENKKLEKDKKEMQNQIDTKENEKKHLENKNEEYLNKIGYVEREIDFWEKINDIPDKYISFFDELAGEKSVIAYLSIGREMSKIKQLYQYIQNVVVADNEGLPVDKILNDFLGQCVRVYNLSREEHEKIKKIELNEGMEFDLGKTIKTTNSKNIGSVSEVLIDGYMNGKNDVVFKGIVRID